MTTKVRITNIVEEGNAHSNGDLLIEGLGDKRELFPGDTMEEWVRGPVTLTERWPSQKPKDAA